VSIADIVRLFVTKKYSSADVELVRRALEVAEFPESWKEEFAERIAR